MKASELRLGNYLAVNSGIQEVKEIGINEISTGKKYSYSEFAAYYPHVIKHSELEVGSYAIPLTEEWLLKFGLTTAHYSDRDSPRYELPGYGYEIRLGDDGEHGVYFEGNCMTYIKFVHQLQNLTYSLTEEELTIKEPAV